MTPTARLEKLLEDLHLATTGNDAARHKAQIEADVRCAIEIIAAMGRLAAAVNDMANRSETASIESGKVAAESANLSRKLNRLTVWIVIAAIASAAAAGVQAWAAWYTVTHHL